MHHARSTAGAPRRRPFPGYAPMLYVGLVVALLTGDALARRAGLDPVRTVLALALSAPVCLAGARGLAVALDWSYFRSHPKEIPRVRKGGAAMYGALPPALLFTAVLVPLLGLPFLAFWDVAVVAILAGMIPTRLGCLSAGCCAGRPTRGPLGLRLRNARGVVARRIPMPLVEAALGAVLLALALRFSEERPFPGAVACLALGAYAAGRFALEGLREDRGRVTAGLGALQWSSLVFVGFAACGLFGGWIATGGGRELVAAAAGTPGAAHLVAGALLLLPVAYLFRFLGCSLLLTEDGAEEPPPPTHTVQLRAEVPDLLDAGGITVVMHVREESDGSEVPSSPFDLPEIGQVGNRVGFELFALIPEGMHEAECIVSQPGAFSRQERCSGSVEGPNLQVFFEADRADDPTALTATLCFVDPSA